MITNYRSERLARGQDQERVVEESVHSGAGQGLGHDRIEILTGEYCS
jgi:hypothetical protein